MSNKTNSTLYIGVSSDLQSRVYEHRSNYYPGSFTSRYKCFKLVYFENFSSIEEAITREKKLKGWLRTRKDQLIDQYNPERRDLYGELLE